LAIGVLGLRCAMLMLGLLALAHAHHGMAAAAGLGHAEGTCEAGPAVLHREAPTAAIEGVQPMLSPPGAGDVRALQAHVPPPCPPERLGTWPCPQSQLHSFVHVFRC
jgi:hypothetical protein